MASNDGTDFPITSQDTKTIQEAFQKGGVTAVNTVVSQTLDKWKEYPINVGVTGNSGTGKSSFINALRGLSADDHGAAAVGVVETTRAPKPYQHPNNEKLLLWDLPGVGTPAFTRGQYLDAIDVNRYDYFIIISSCRFTENDQWLGQRLKERNKKFYFVRTKLDEDTRSDKLSHPKTHDETKVIATIRNDCQKNIVDDVYLIDNYRINAFDFPRLEHRLIIDAPELKREAILFTLSPLSDRMILEKKKALMKRIPKVALISAIGGLVPIPGVGILVDIFALKNEVNFYQQQFGLSDEAREKYAKLSGTKPKPSKVVCNLADLASKGIAAYMAKLGITKVAPKVMAIAFPILGSIVNGSLSYAYCCYSLKNLLDMAVQDAFTLSVCKK